MIYFPPSNPSKVYVGGVLVGRVWRSLTVTAVSYRAERFDGVPVPGEFRTRGMAEAAIVESVTS
jgi:hypothetical protein